jgi:hypothetical protein
MKWFYLFYIKFLIIKILIHEKKLELFIKKKNKKFNSRDLGFNIILLKENNFF